ncbi:MAG: T9SS type A sorting domain-containing protein, partial [Bacteroidales bacterium]|nr:T9SS type A sorting domain-containing protein [Bacteroidales bacterium]
VHLISVTTDGHGTVSPGGDASNSVAVPDGESITFDINPDNGYQIDEIYVDYQLQHRTNPFIINNVTAPHVLYVTFKERLALESADEPCLKVYPNPASDNVTIALANTAQSEYSLYDMAGREIAKGVLMADNPVRLDLSHLSNGVYYIKVVGENFRTTEKIIVTK